MEATYLLLALAAGLAFVLGTRAPGRLASPEGARALGAAAVLGIGVALMALWAGKLGEFECPAGFDASGNCLGESRGMAGMGMLGLALPLAVAVLFLLKAPGGALPRPTAVMAPKKPVARPMRTTAEAPAELLEDELDDSPEEAAPAHTAAAEDDSTAAGEPAVADEPEAPVEAATGEESTEGEAEDEDTLRRPTEGPVTAALIEGQASDLEAAMLEAASRMGTRPAALFSVRATNEANRALARLATAIGARRYTDADPIGGANGPNVRGARNAAGDSVRHVGELALDLAGRMCDSVILLDSRVAFSELAIMSLSQVGSVCIADEHTSATAHGAVVLPAVPFDAEAGTLTAEDGVDSNREATGEAREGQFSRVDLIRMLAAALGHDLEAHPETPPTVAPSLFAPPPRPANDDDA